MVHENIQSGQITSLIAVKGVVERRVAPGAALERVEEIIDDLVERHPVFEDSAGRLDVLRGLIDAPALLAERHDRPDVLGRQHDLRLHHRLLHVVDLRRIRQIGRIGEIDHIPVGLVNLVDHARRRRDQVKIILSLQPLLNHIQMEQTEKAAAESESQRLGRLRLILKRRVVQLEFLQRVAQIRVLRRLRRVDAAVDHRLRLLVARQRLGAGALCVRHRVADPREAHLFDACLKVAHRAGCQFIGRNEFSRPEDTDLRHLELRAGRHHADLRALPHGPVENPHEDDHAAVAVVERIEDQRLQRSVRVAGGRRKLVHDRLEHLMDVEPSLRRDARRVLRIQTDDILDLLRGLVRLRAREIDLVDDRKDLQIVIKREIHVAQRLGLHALSGVHYQHRAVAGGEAP